MDTEYYAQYPPGMKMTDGIPGNYSATWKLDDWLLEQWWNYQPPGVMDARQLNI